MTTTVEQITKIEDIPYCGDIYIEGFWNKDYTHIEKYEGGLSPNQENDPHYFQAKWTQSRRGRHGEYREL